MQGARNPEKRGVLLLRVAMKKDACNITDKFFQQPVKKGGRCYSFCFSYL
jgi:hypothetical protein